MEYKITGNKGGQFLVGTHSGDFNYSTGLLFAHWALGVATETGKEWVGNQRQPVSITTDTGTVHWDCRTYKILRYNVRYNDEFYSG